MKAFISFVTVILFLFSFFLYCDDLPDIPEEKDLTLESITIEPFVIPDTVWTQSDDSVFIAVKVYPYELAEKTNIVIFNFSFDQTSGQSADWLLDDGNYPGSSGDLIPGDGIFSLKVPSSRVQDQEGDYTISFKAYQVQQNQPVNPSTEFSFPITFLNSSKGSAPVLSNAVYPDSININTDMTYYLTVNVSDLEGYADISVVKAKVYPPLSPSPSRTLYLRDDGNGGDTKTGDGVFTLNLDHSTTGPEGLGKYSLLLEASDLSGNISNELVANITYLSELPNQPPVISELSAPDTVQLISAHRITLKVYDPDGLLDISRVYFNSILPNGQPSSGNPFLLRDDGGENSASEDVTKGDGIYTITIQVGQTAQKGTYHFIFQAEDSAGNISNQIDKTIVITF